MTLNHQRHSEYNITKDIQSNIPGRALCLLTLGHISVYNMDNTILLYKQWVSNSIFIKDLVS
jgi:hypothetical protein